MRFLMVAIREAAEFELQIQVTDSSPLTVANFVKFGKSDAEV